MRYQKQHRPSRSDVCCNSCLRISPTSVIGPCRMATLRWAWGLVLLVTTACALHFDPSQIAYNINTNQTATDPINYSGEWQNHTFHPSPLNWRVPFYTILLDRFVNGNPTNDNANGTQFEHDISQTQLRHGGDIKGLQDSLDYLQGMGVKVGLTYIIVARKGP